MNAKRTAYPANRLSRRLTALVSSACLLVVSGLTATLSASSAAPISGNTGKALILRAAIHAVSSPSLLTSKAKLLQTSPFVPSGRPRNGANGRFILDKSQLAGGGARGAKFSTAGRVLINEGVQTFDVFAPPPTFTPTDQVAGQTLSTLTPMNLTPVWSADETYLVFSSNRDAAGNVASNGKFHIWTISANGGIAQQITSGSGNDFYPALNTSNTQLAFTSDANSAGTQNLYTINFSPAPGTPTDLAALTGAQNAKTLNTSNRTFSNVQRPTWSPGSDRIAFAAFTTTDADSASTSRNHIYYLYVSSNGYLPGAPDPSNPPAKLTTGPAEDIDPAWSPDGRFIAFASTAAALTDSASGTQITPTNAPTVTTNAGTAHNIFFLSGGTQTAFGTRANAGNPFTLVGSDNTGPAWSFPTRNNYTNPNGTALYLAFARNPSGAAGGPHDIYYILATNNGATIVPESSGNAAKNLNVNPGNSVQSDDPTNLYDDIYPTWAPFQSIYSLAYSSNRSITYNDPPTTGTTQFIPLEAPRSIPRGTAPVGANYAGILQTQLINLDPPTLLRFSSQDIVGVAPNSNPGVAVKQVQPGQTVRFTVRLSDREAGIDEDNVYLQIKDPDSRYQDTQGLEHKVFARSPYETSGSDVDWIYNGGLGVGFNYLTPPGGTQPQLFPQDGVIAGHDGTDTIAIGRGTTLANYISYGQEYECQFVNPSVANPTAADYGRPFYLAGIDDQQPFSGLGTQRDSTEWLKLTRATAQDKLGGVLFNATYTTPGAASDFYLDVIAYDKAINPLTGDATNWRIYDNVGGFTTANFDGSNDILVVSDNALGQKFALSSFGGSGLGNIAPVLWGAESYITDIDVTKLPNATYLNKIVTLPDGTQQLQQIVQPLQYYDSVTQRIATGGVLNGLGIGSYFEGEENLIPKNSRSQLYSLWRILSRGPIDSNILNSFAPTFQSQPAVNDPATGFTAPAADGAAANAPKVPIAPKCVIWISPFTGDLFVGPGSLADPDTQNKIRQYASIGGRFCISGQNVVSGLTGNGSVNNGQGSFVYDVLNVQLVNPQGGNTKLTGASAAGNRISYDSYFNVDPSIGFRVRGNFFIINPDFTVSYHAPGQDPLYLGNNNIIAGNPPNVTDWRTDGSMDQLGPFVGGYGNFSQNTLTGRIDTILPVANSETRVPKTDVTFSVGGAAGLIYNENYTTGSRFVFSSFGLEGLGIEVYKFTDTGNPAQDHYVPRNHRPNVLHNIVSYLRTGTITGTIRDTTGGGAGVGVAGAIVYAISFNGVAIPGPRQAFSATTNSDGSYTIGGLEPGGYYIVAYKDGYSRAQTTFRTKVAGDTTVTGVGVNIVRQPPGSLSGRVTDSSNSNSATNGIPGATVTFISTDGVTTVSAITNANGNYSIANVPVNTYVGKATKRPQYNDSANATVTVTSANNTVQDFVLTPGTGIIKGHVYNQLTGSPIPNATVAFDIGTGTPQTATTDSNGDYTSPPLMTGTSGATSYTVTVSAIGFFDNSVTVSLSQNQTVTKNIPLIPLRDGTVGGLVVDSFTGQPVGGVTVTFTNSVNGDTKTFTTTASASSPGSGDGRPLNYGVQSLLQGTYDVTVTKQYYTTVRRTGIVIRPGVFNRVDFIGANALPSQLGTVGGLVTNSATGQPLANVAITVANATTGSILLNLTTRGTTISTGRPTGDGSPTNYSGTLLQGTYRVTATLFGFATQTKTVTVSPNQLARANFTMVSTLGTIGGLVRDPLTTALLSGVTITVLDSSGATVRTATSTASTTSPVSPNGDAKPLNYSLQVPAGTYTVRATKTGYNAANIPSVKVTVGKFTRVDFVGGTAPPATQGLVGGLVSDAVTGGLLAGATITVTDTTSAKNVIATFTTTGTSSLSAPVAPIGDGKPVNYIGYVPAGTYTVTASKVGLTPVSRTATIVNNSFTRVDFTGTNAPQPLHIFSAGLNFFSVPYDYTNLGASFINTVFGSLNTGTSTSPSRGSNRSRLTAWSPLLVQYVFDPTAPTDALRPGQGYWISLQKPVGLTVTGAAPPNPTSVALHPDWNMIGVPRTTPIRVSSLMFGIRGGTPVTFAQATSSAYNLVDKTVYRYDRVNNRYQPVTATATDVAISESNALMPYEAYWIRAIVDTTVLLPSN